MGMKGKSRMTYTFSSLALIDKIDHEGTKSETMSSTTSNVVILGYYHKQNAGDDAFRIVFEAMLNPKLYNLCFINPSVQLQRDPEWTLPDNTDCVIVGVC